MTFSSNNPVGIIVPNNKEQDMSQDNVPPTVVVPAFSMQPPEGTFKIVGYANKAVVALHVAYLEQVIAAGKLFTEFNGQLETDNNNHFREYQRRLTEANYLYNKIIQMTAQLTGYMHPFFLPGPDWQIGVMNSQLKEVIVDRDPAAW